MLCPFRAAIQRGVRIPRALSGALLSFHSRRLNQLRLIRGDSRPRARKQRNAGPVCRGGTLFVAYAVNWGNVCVPRGRVRSAVSVAPGIRQREKVFMKKFVLASVLALCLSAAAGREASAHPGNSTF